MRQNIILFAIFLVSILAVGAVSAAENVSDDVLTVTEDDTICVSDNEDILDASNSTDGEPILSSELNTTVEVLSSTNPNETLQASSSDDVVCAINSDSADAEPVLKSSKIKTVKMKVKYKWTTKKIGKYKIKARLWRVTTYMGYVNYLDIILYKNGVQQSCSEYLSKYSYKKNGKWKWWPKWRYGGVDHAYHRYINDLPIKSIKVKFRY